MTFLQLVYWLANGLAVLAMLAALSVFFARILRHGLEAKRLAGRSRLLLEIATSLQEDGANDQTARLMAQDRRLAAGLLQELTELIAGGQRDQLCSLARTAGLDRWLMTDLRSPRAERRRIAAETLRLFDGPEVSAALNRAVDDRNADVRISAALSLVELGIAPPLLGLIERLRLSPQAHPLILSRLFLHVAPEQLDDMFAIAEGHQGAAFLRPFAIDAIGAMGRLDLAERLALIAGDADPAVRGTVLHAVAALGHTTKRDIVAAGLNDPAWEVRAQAVQAAQRLERLDLVWRIAQLAEDEVWWVRFRSTECLAAMGEAGLGALRELAAAARRMPARRASVDRRPSAA